MLMNRFLIINIIFGMCYLFVFCSSFKMPKKFIGMNSKAMEAKSRRDAIKQDADAKKQKAIEDELWRDDDKNIAKKQKRKVSFFYIFYLTIMLMIYYFLTMLNGNLWYCLSKIKRMLEPSIFDLNLIFHTTQ